MTDTTKLEQSAELAIGAFSQAIINDVDVFQKLQDKEPQILLHIAELRMDIKFILMDLGTSFIAACKSKEPYACRFHLKNLDAGIQEAYKLLLNYGKSQRYTVWKRIGKMLNEKPVCELEENANFLKDYQLITTQLEKIAGDENDKLHRDLTYHYDANMKLVYDYTVAAYNLEEASTKFIMVFQVLKDIFKLCDSIETCLSSKGIETIVHTETSSIDDSLHLALIQHLNQNKELPKTLDMVLRDVQPIDYYAQHHEKFNKLKDVVAGQIEFPELDNVNTMLNLQLTILFMRADMAAISKAFLLSKTNGEAMLNMRRYVITITAAFGHLYGYSETERANSIWSSVVGMMPAENQKLKDEAGEIDDMLSNIVLRRDMDLRTNYVHLLDNQSHKTNIPTILSLLRNQNPILEIQKVTIMLQVTKKIMDFMKKVMEELAQKTHEANEKSTIELREQLKKIKGIAEHPDCPDMLKDTLLEIVNKVQTWTKIEL